MSNSIPERQNSPEQIDLLLAARRAYRVAKSAANTQLFLAISAIIASQIAFHWFPGDQDWKALAAVYSFVVLFLNTVPLENRRGYYQRMAANIQEVFDTKVFDLAWNKHRLGTRTAKEEINRLVRAAKNPGMVRKLLKRLGLSKEIELKDWYPSEVGRLPLGPARLVCQRASLYWDAKQRRNFTCGVKLTGYAFASMTILGCTYLSLDLNTIVISILAPVLPLTAKVYLDVCKHESSADTTDRAKSLLESSWEKVIQDASSLDEGDMDEAARRVQDELYDRRSTSPSVPELFYQFFRKGFEEDMNEGAEEMIAVAEASLDSP